MSTLAVDNFKPSAGGTSFGLGGIAKAQANYDQVTPAVTSSENVTSISDDATGEWTPTFTNVFANALYGEASTAGSDSVSASVGICGRDANGAAPTTSTMRMQTTSNNGTNDDRDSSSATWFGDLA